MADVVVLLRDVWKSYTYLGSSISILRGINMIAYRGEAVGIHGPSGSGKTTLLKIIAGLERPDKGEVIIDGYNLNMLDEYGLALYRNNVCSYIPQDFAVVDSMTVYENAEIPLLLAGVDVGIRRKKVMEVLEYVGLKEKANAKVGKLSGGEKQRVAIGRALVTTPSVLLADEPTANLDWSNAIKVAELFLDIKKDFSTTVVIVTHDARLLEYVDRSMSLFEGVLKQISSPKL
ncbi:MAG: ABC transporter ATP-binding protein [Sulfolobales archaeon]|nr:ABC transporter ATP-binding protein [Sulfolobales archaeon]MDW8083409.1 ABC transporter ATP-binding protein [Sulfolobales archaeon]